MAPSEELWKQTRGIREKRRKLREEMDAIAPLQPLDPNRPVPVLGSDYIVKLAEYYSLGEREDELLEEYHRAIEAERGV